MPLPLYVVDAFTDRPFAGNPAAICLLDRPADDIDAIGHFHRFRNSGN